MVSGTQTQKMTMATEYANYEEFASAYRALWAKQWQYTPTQIGWDTIGDMLVDLGDRYPEWLERLESEGN